MQSEQPEQQLVTAALPDGRFAFQIEIPSNWASLPVPPEQVDFSNDGIAQPVGALVAKYGAVLLTLSVRPGFDDGSVAEWLRRVCMADNVRIGNIVTAKAGSIPAVGAPGGQDSNAGPMTMRILAFEQGGWLHLLMAMAPAAIWDSVAPTFDRMIASFAMTSPMHSSVPLWPPVTEPAGDAVPATGPALSLSAQDLSLARQVADQFFQALQRGDEAAAKALLIPHEGESVDLNAMQPGASGGYELGQPRAEGDEVIVDAKLTGAAPQESGASPQEAGPQEQALPLVLRRVDGDWKIDMGASITRMLGVNVEDAMTGMAEGLGNAMAKGVEAFAEGLAAMSPPEDETESFGDVVNLLCDTDLHDEKVKIFDAIGKQLEVVVDWDSLAESRQAARRIAPLVLRPVGEAIRMTAENAEEREKLQGVLDRVFIRQVDRPEERACTLDGGQLELAVCLADLPGQDEPAGTFTVREIAEVLRQAIR